MLGSDFRDVDVVKVDGFVIVAAEREIDVASAPAAADRIIKFRARLNGGRALVRVSRDRIEWSVSDHRLAVEAIPMTLITAVSTKPGWFRSTLIVKTQERTVEFRVDRNLADETRALIQLLMAVSSQLAEPYSLKVAGEAAVADELIDLRSLLNAGSVDYLDYEEQRARLLGY